MTFDPRPDPVEGWPVGRLPKPRGQAPPTAKQALEAFDRKDDAALCAAERRTAEALLDYYLKVMPVEERAHYYKGVRERRAR